MQETSVAEKSFQENYTEFDGLFSIDSCQNMEKEKESELEQGKIDSYTFP